MNYSVDVGDEQPNIGMDDSQAKVDVGDSQRDIGVSHTGQVADGECVKQDIPDCYEGNEIVYFHLTVVKLYEFVCQCIIRTLE